MSNILISEIFGPTIQGEGALIGVPTIFVRTAGCDYNCDWCDTLYAVDTSFRKQWHKMTSQQILDRIDELSGGEPILVTLSGGNPALQPLGTLIELGQSQGYEFALETQGSVSRDWFERLNALTISPKPPSARVNFMPQKLQDCIDATGLDTRISLKIVIADETDLNWTENIRQTYPDIPLILQPCNTDSAKTNIDTFALNEKLCWLVDAVNRRNWYKVRVLPQLHVLLWGNQRGV